MSTLNDEFHAEMLGLYKRTGKAMGYWPNYFLRKVKRVRGLKYAQDLLQPSKKGFSGFGRLADENQLELSVEYMVLVPKWAPLFTEQERQIARKRLTDAGFDAFPDTEPDEIIFFNNCRNRPHEELFGSGAFYDLNTTGVQAKQATRLRTGQECVVATMADDGKVIFTSYSFLVERFVTERDGDGVEQFRVFFGTKVIAETMTKADAANDPVYAPFFNVNGHFKQQSVIEGQVSSGNAKQNGKSGGMTEGTPRSITLTVYERSTAARKRCIDHYGAVCNVCDFDFAGVYGPVATGFIHVHHVKAISEIGKEYVVHPIKDLRPVCPNCHAVIHLGGECRGIEDVKELIKAATGKRKG